MKRNPPDLVLFGVILLLLLIGLIIVTSASAPESLKVTNGASVFNYGLRQLMFAIIGLGLLIFMLKFPHPNLKRYTVIIAVCSIVALVAVLFLGRSVNGARRWIYLGFFPFQSSEFAKIGTVLVLAHYLSEIKKGVTNFFVGIVIPCFFVAIVCALIMMEPDLGTVIVIFGTLMMMIYVAGAKISHLTLIALLGVAGVAVLVLMEPYRFQRLLAFVDPWKDKQGNGWQIIQSLFALGSGGPFGLGLGMGRQKFDYLPEAHTDYIFSILGEELGLIGTVTVIVLFFLLAWRGYKTAIAARDPYGRILAAGLTSYLVFQALLNISVVTSSVPVTGITLPFLSYGGSSLLVSLFSVGILLNISKNSELRL